MSTHHLYTQVLATPLPFPPLCWWKAALQAPVLILDRKEPYQKMSYRNRYYLADKKGKSLLSIPLSHGRNQRIAMDAVGISYAEDWQKVHWRTLKTLLGNSPFFEYIDYQLYPFYEQQTDLLFDWNIATIHWANRFMGSPLEIRYTDQYVDHCGTGTLDLRQQIQPKVVVDMPPYHQVFAAETGFLTDCSILDLICCEGKYALQYLMSS